MPKKPPVSLKKRVRIFLANEDLNQGQLAERLGIAPSHLSEILSGKQSASLSVAAALEDVTGIPAREFLATETASA